jgi:hypothetical protein
MILRPVRSDGFVAGSMLVWCQTNRQQQQLVVRLSMPTKTNTAKQFADNKKSAT